MDVQGYISPEEVRHALRQIYRTDAETNLRSSLLESLSDAFTPIDEKGRLKPSPLLLLAFLLLCTLLGIFVYFSVGGRG
jgi:hypothetical protein